MRHKIALQSLVLLLALPISWVGAQDAQRIAPSVQRLSTNPIIRPEMLPEGDGDSINGPSLIHVPEWLENPLGRYYLYFAHHEGTYLRLAFSDSLSGPWSVYEPGVLRLDQTPCEGPAGEPIDIASPEVIIDEDSREIRMYFHCAVYVGGDRAEGSSFPQRTLLARSDDGLAFASDTEHLGRAYFRIFRWDNSYHAMAMPGIFYRSDDGVSDFVEGPTLFDRTMRHSAVRVDGDTLQIFYTAVGDIPERILLSQVTMTPDWMTWEASEPIVVLEPEEDWEGASLPFGASERGGVFEPVNQLRDPGIFEENGQTYLIYSVAGEQGLAIAELSW